MDNNEHIDSFIARLKGRYSIDSDDMTTSDWLERNTTLRRRPYSMDKFPFQRQIADDFHQNMSVIKPSQVGLTEVQIRKVLSWVRRNDGVSVIYTMPTDEMRNRVSQTRIRPIIEEDSVFNSEFDEEAVRSKGLLQFGQSFLYITGAKEGDATSIPADMVVNDEIDLTNEEMLALFRSRLQASDYKINQKFSTPTYPRAGVSKDYNDSDQHEYVVKCESCNHVQIPLFSRAFCHIPGVGDRHEALIDAIDLDSVGDLDLHNSYIKCEKCHSPLDLANAENREWVPTYPSKSIVSRGYQIRPFSSANLDIVYIVRELLEAKKRNTMRRFHNTVLGEAYIDDSIALNEAIVRERMSRPNGWDYTGQPCFVGIDVGMICHITVGCYYHNDGWIVFHWDTVPATELVSYVEGLCDRYNVVGGSIDRFPYTPTAVDVRTVSRGKIVPVEYRNPSEINVKENELDPEQSYGQVNRTMALDEVAKFVRSKKITFVNYEDRQNVIVKHLTDMVRHEEEGEKPLWKKQTGEDHFFHALAFMMAGKKFQDYIISNSILDIRSLVSSVPVDMKPTRLETIDLRRPRASEVRRFGFRDE